MKNHLQSIAVVDCNESVLDAVKVALENQQWLISTYSDGQALMSNLQHKIPDCVVLEPHLPGGDSIDLFRALVNRHSPTIPVILLTAYPDSPTVRKLKEIGAYAILIKPVSVEALVKHIEAAISP